MDTDTNSESTRKSAIEGYEIASDFRHIAQDLIDFINILTLHLERGRDDQLSRNKLEKAWENLPEPVCKELERSAKFLNLHCI